ncbi:MAG: molecular chaperone HtpG, partial [Oscillospiraceae bacterium]|nr:molecular chaperone HtpG [Oscillospiraceae bacterium]
KGVIDCPDLPLNVSRSFLQNDGSVKKLSDHIAKKVSDRLTSMFEGERERYCGYWDDISPFVKYGCLKDDKFYDRIKEAVVFKSTKGGHVTAKEYAELNDDRHKGKVYYVSDAKQQSAYMDMFERNGMEAVILDTLIDGHFISYLEYKGGDVRFARIDSDIADSLKGADDPGGDGARVVAAFEEALKSRSVKVAAQPIKGDPRPGYILLSEHSRRMQEMGARFGGGSMPAFPKDETFSVNTGSEVVMGIASILDDESRKDEAMEICRYVYDVALMSHRPLTPDEMREFASRSDVIVGRMLKGG